MNIIKQGNTARVRKKPSVPAAFLLDWLKENSDDQNQSILDWGCGQGYDLIAFKNAGYSVGGYDPHWQPQYPHATIWDYVTCFYVLNVIPLHEKRIECIKKLFCHVAYNGRVFIAVRSQHKINFYAKNWKCYNDGYLTGRGTFQRGFTHENLKDLVEGAGLCYHKWGKNFVGCIITNEI